MNQDVEVGELGTVIGEWGGGVQLKGTERSWSGRHAGPQPEGSCTCV